MEEKVEREGAVCFAYENYNKETVYLWCSFCIGSVGVFTANMTISTGISYRKKQLLC